MKQLMTYVLVGIATIALTTPANAQFRGEVQNTVNQITNQVQDMGAGICANHRGTGDAAEQSWCYGRIIGPNGRLEGFNPNSVAAQYAARGYGQPRQPGNWFERRLHDIFGPEQYYPYGTRPGYYGGYSYGVGRYDDETQGKCVERVVKAARKSKQPFDVDSIQARCAGMQPPPKQPQSAPPVIQAPVSPQGTQVAQEPVEVIGDQHAPEPPPMSPSRNSSVIRSDIPRGWSIRGLCLRNNEDRVLHIYLNGREVAQVLPGSFTSITKLPKGDLHYAY